MHLGIDLGTSNSAVVGNLNSQLRVFKTGDGSDVLPSVIYIDQRGHRLYGRRAYEQTRLSPDNVAKGFKRLNGDLDADEISSVGTGDDARRMQRRNPPPTRLAGTLGDKCVG